MAHSNADLDYDVIVIGAGIAGMYQLYRLREMGLTVRVLRKRDGSGRHLVLEPVPWRPV